MPPHYRKSYKSYFSNSNDTPASIPRRTKFRNIRPRRLYTREDHQQPSNRPRPPENFSDSSVNHEEETSLIPEIRLPTIDVEEHVQSTMDVDTDSTLNDSTDEEEPNAENELPFSNARISRKESLLLLYGFLLRHKLTKSATSDLLNLVNFHLPTNVSIPTSVFLLEKSLFPDYSPATKNMYCPDCESVVEEEDANCLKSISKKNLLKIGNFFITLDLRKSFQNLLTNPEIRKRLMKAFGKRQTRENGVMHDIMDGDMYKKLPLKTHDITCSINTDGVSIFKSSKCSLWPILISINELTYPLRRRNTLLVGLWFGSAKPVFDTFHTPFIQQCNELTETGITWYHNSIPYTSSVFFPIAAADSVARCGLQGIKQFNGEYGCPWCLTKGDSYSDEGVNRRWIFPFGSFVKRTPFTFVEHLKVLRYNLENNCHQNCFGLKLASPFLLVKNFDIVNGFVFDYMHTCLLGVVRTMTMKWMGSNNHCEDYYIGTKLDEINERFLRCKVPPECSRVTRSVKDMRYWKAHEWKTWTLVAIPVLQDILKPAYVKHFAKFVYALCTLTSTSVNENGLTKSSVFLKEFCSTAPALYGNDICTFNLHLLLHMVDCVRNWGPLWGYSLFQFEHVNGILTSSFFGTTQVCMQIIRRVSITQQVTSLGRTSFESDLAQQFFNSLIDFKRYSLSAVCVNNTTFIGPKKTFVFNDREKEELTKLGIIDIDNAHSFHSIIMKGKKYSVFKRDTSKHVNSIVNIDGKLHHCVAFILAGKTTTHALAVVRRIKTIPVTYLNGSHKVVYVSDATKIINLSVINDYKYVCVYSSCNNLKLLVQLPNIIELE